MMQGHSKGWSEVWSKGSIIVFSYCAASQGGCRRGVVAHQKDYQKSLQEKREFKYFRDLRKITLWLAAKTILEKER